MKNYCTLIALLSTQLLFAQTFTKVEEGLPFQAVACSSVVFFDANGDNHLDLIITGQTDDPDQPTSDLFFGDGSGGFTEVMNTPFTGVACSAVVTGDVNGDSYPDVMITGRDAEENPTAKLFLNDGIGTFAEVESVPFRQVAFSSSALGDINGDGFLDLLITGSDTFYNPDTRLYTNDGIGQFTEVSDTGFSPVSYSAVAIADLNGDTHSDILITGASSSGLVAELHINNGNGVFQLQEGTPFTGVTDSAVAIADVNGDSYPDVLISGTTQTNPSSSATTLYLNNGSGNFTEDENANLEDVSFGTIDLSDIDRDGDLDLLITGLNNETQQITVLYVNDGAGNFTQVNDTPFAPVWGSAVAFADVNEDMLPDLIISGQSQFQAPFLTELYINDGVTSTEQELDATWSLDLYPIPSVGDILNIRLQAAENDELFTRVLSPDGAVLMTTVRQIIPGVNHLELDISALPSGVYLLELMLNESKATRSFVVP